ncbi:MAG: hypothetical protein E7199_03630 [Schwartzia succinivorans]|nr:hypothetical protein [Schwartzia succinivorans]
MAIVATALLVVPLTRWYITMTQGVENLQDKLAMQAIIQDHWLTLNDEGFDELSAAIATKGTTWEENVGEGGRYTITTSFGDAGKYVNAACTNGTPGTDERQCRKVSVQIKDNVTGQTQALNLTKVASQTDKRLKDLETKAVALDGRITSVNSNLSSSISSVNSSLTSRINTVDGKFGSYYTAAQVDSKISATSGAGVSTSFTVLYRGHASCYSAYRITIRNGIVTSVTDASDDSCQSYG